MLHPGDSESIDGHTIYEYGDYPGWAYWNPEVEDSPIDGNVDFRDLVTQVPHDAYWACEHDEDGESIIAFCGPYFIPELPTELKS